jgi:hypothetical protein
MEKCPPMQGAGAGGEEMGYAQNKIQFKQETYDKPWDMGRTSFQTNPCLGEIEVVSEVVKWRFAGFTPYQHILREFQTAEVPRKSQGMGGCHFDLACSPGYISTF